METRYTDLSDPQITRPLDDRRYRPSKPEEWRGRIDGDDPSHLRWHQGIQCCNLRESSEVLGNGRALFLLGFACDEGVRRNAGRVGAAGGPAAIRRELSNLPFAELRSGQLQIWDGGDILCEDGALEESQEQLGLAVAEILRRGGTPIVLGGGHEVTYGHYLGLRRSLHGGTERLGLVNFDAHFDNRKPGASGPSSGTGYYQIAQSTMSDQFHYLAIGIQRSSNTAALFAQAAETGTKHILAEELRHSPPYMIPQQLSLFLRQVDRVYLSLDMDVFASAYAPGVSAPTPLGLIPDQAFFNCLDAILQSGQLLSLDLAELNPKLDVDGRTAKLAAALIFHIASKLM